MDFLGKVDLFSRTVENRFVFHLFDLLLCGVIVLVILRGWRRHPRWVSTKNQVWLFLGFSSLGASFAGGAIFAGALLFFQRRLPEAPFDLVTHALQAGAWVLLAASTYHRPMRGPLEAAASRRRSSIPFLLLVPPGLYLTELATPLYLKANTVFDLVNLFLLVLTLALFYRQPMGGRNLATGAVAALFVGAWLHMGSSLALEARGSAILWNLEQFAGSLALFLFALAIGETGRDLFDRVFVRLQVAFILLASLMILVITQSEKTEYLSSIRSRSDQLVKFVRTHVDYFFQHNESLHAIMEGEDLRQRITLDFGNLPELKIVRIAAGRQIVSFEIVDNGLIRRDWQTLPSSRAPARLDSEEYFLIHALPLATRPGEVELYGTRRFLDRHIGKRILIIFSLFTGMVALSTLMIGLVVRGASATIREQAREIEEAQRQLMQASKLAAIGELAAGVAHEINNPVTTILSRASLLLSEEDADLSSSDREDLTAIVTQAQRITQITRGLLMFSRPHALDIKANRMDSILERELSSVAELMTAQHISVEKRLPPDLPRVLADADSLARALENLFRNAIDAMPGGGTLTIQAAREGSSPARLRLEISDTGVGIEKDNLARIFDPFFTTKEVGKGTGLGLSIVHGIIKEHHGTISVESQPGVGTQFTIVLPMED
ncbi:MAG: hypothetical protein HYR55_13085 [Acidobacteria bacterium]|nr:hypothetical protein [Acidobacteriota bacterium]